MIFIYTWYGSDIWFLKDFMNILLILFFKYKNQPQNFIFTLLRFGLFNLLSRETPIYSVLWSLICYNMKFLIRPSLACDSESRTTALLSLHPFRYWKNTVSLISDGQVIALILFTTLNQKYRKLASEFHKLQRRERHINLIVLSTLFLCFPSDNSRKR